MEGTPDAGNKNPKLPDESQWDSEFRLGHLDAQGVAAEVLFPNGLPFVDARFQDAATSNDLALAARGGAPTTGGSPTSARRRRDAAPARP